MSSAALLSAAMQGPGVGITTAIDPGNRPSAANMRNQGFGPWAEVVPEAYESCSSCPNRTSATDQRRRCCCDFFLLPLDAARERVRDLLIESANDGFVLRGKNGTRQLDASKCKIISDEDYRLALSEFADSKIW